MDSELTLTRRIFAASGAAAALLAAPACSRADRPSQIRSMRCADFLDTIGINTHVSYKDSQYNDVSAVLGALRYTGVKLVRDMAINSQLPNPGHYGTLAADGVSFCLFWGVRRSMESAIAEIAALEAAHPGAIHALEGPNEIKQDFSYAGLKGDDAGRKFMADMRAAAAADAHLRRKPLVCFTSYDDVRAADCNYANYHPYPKAGSQPDELLRRTVTQNVGPSGAMPGKPIVFTEFGYHTLVGKPAKPGNWQGVDPERHAVLTLNGVLDGASLGVTRTYIYQLFDAYPDAERKAQGRHFGLFGFDGAPKPAAGALKRLFAQLADTAPQARSFPQQAFPGHLEVSAPVSALILQHSTGRWFVALWNEAPLWDKDAAAPRDVAPLHVQISLSEALAVQTHDLIDPAKDSSPGTVKTADIMVGLHPTIVQIG